MADLLATISSLLATRPGSAVRQEKIFGQCAEAGFDETPKRSARVPLVPRPGRSDSTISEDPARVADPELPVDCSSAAIRGPVPDTDLVA